MSTDVKEFNLVAAEGMRHHSSGLVSDFKATVAPDVSGIDFRNSPTVAVGKFHLGGPSVV